MCDFLMGLFSGSYSKKNLMACQLHIKCEIAYTEVDSYIIRIKAETKIYNTGLYSEKDPFGSCPQCLHCVFCWVSET